MLPSDWQMTVSHRSRDENPSCALLCFAVVLMNPIGALNKKVDVIADINPMKLAWTLKVVIMRLYEFPIKWNPREIYSMELVLQDEMGDRIHCSIPKSNMVFISYEKIEAMVGVNKNHLLDCMGHVVGREDVTPLVTKSREESKCIKLHLEDLKSISCLFSILFLCTLVGDLVDKILGLFNKNNGKPIILMAQIFKPNFYLNECINYIQSHPVNSVSDELHGGSLQITTIEEVFDKTNVSFSIVFSTMAYGLHVIADDGTVCIGLIIWNQEANLVVKKFANKVKDLSYSGSESIFECDLETPGKGVVADSNAGATIGGVYSLDVQGSTTKPSKGCAGKRKL
ncbi:uncharacterized protein DS421_7g220460 [Arachis hypogaea]|nr:uncharacterized protein DS421_7g220460 [Arachis hypogaea]